MAPQDTEDTNPIDPALTEHRARLLSLARLNLNPMLARRISPEDVVQETLAAACRKADFMRNRPDVPVYCKLRTILLQTITDLERKHLRSTKRDAYRELEIDGDGDVSSPGLNWNMFADTVTGPLTQLARQDRYELLRKTMEALPEQQREVVFMRYYQELSFKEIAKITGVSINTSLGRMRYALINLRKLTHQHGVNLILE